MTKKFKIAGWLAGAGVGLVMAAYGTLTRPAAFLLELLPRRYSHYLLGGELVPMHSRVLGIYLGLILATTCGFALCYCFLRRRPDFTFLKTGRGKFLFILLVMLALLTLALAVNRVFWDDEIEHIHASWYVQNGQVPYRDFFEHHHPLFWFLLAPLLSICGEGLMVLVIFRLLILLMAAGIAWLTWRIARLAGGTVEAGFLSVALLFSSFMFLPCVIEIRPDVPMVFLALAAVERLLVFMKERKSEQLLAAAFLAALSFLFLQKVIFLFPAAIVLLCAWRFTGKIGSGLFWKTVAVFLLPLILFTAWLILSGALRDYFLCNWLLNVRRQGAFPLWLVVGRLALVNVVFWISLPAALLSALRPEKSSAAMKVVALFAFTALAALFLLPNPADRHFLLPLPLLSVVVVLFVTGRPFYLERRWPSGLCLAALLLLPLPFLIWLNVPLNGLQLEKIAYVLLHTAPAEPVLDGRNDFNLFRPDLHYFWFNVEEGGMLEDYRHLSGRFLEYGPCRLVKEKRPKVIYLDDREWKACGLWREYLLTPYTGLFIRDDDGGPLNDS